MSDGGLQEFVGNPEGNKEAIRSLVSSIAQGQLRALGYEDTLAKFQEWFKGNPLEGFRFSEETSAEFIEQFKKGLLETYLNELKRIPNKDQARQLVSAALFGIPVSKDEREIVIVSYDFEEPSVKTIQTELRANRDRKDMVRIVPNTDGTIMLAGQIANTGFISENQDPADVRRKLSWGKKVFKGTKQYDSSVSMRITPKGDSLAVYIQKTL